MIQKPLQKPLALEKKTAEKLIIELKDKLDIEDVLNRDVEDVNAISSVNTSNGIQAEAIQALVALGYGSTEATRAVKKVSVTEDTTAEDLLKVALKNMI